MGSAAAVGAPFGDRGLGVARRAAIDRAKGMLMLVYNLDDAEAFNLLRWRSQNTNAKLRDLAHQIAADFLSVPTTASYPLNPSTTTCS